MKHVSNNTDRVAPVPKAGDIPVSSHFLEVVVRLTRAEVVDLFQYMRLDLQSRILGLDDRGLVQLQGKVEYCNELEKFFLSLLK